MRRSSKSANAELRPCCEMLLHRPNVLVKEPAKRTPQKTMVTRKGKVVMLE